MAEEWWEGGGRRGGVMGSRRWSCKGSGATEEGSFFLVCF